MKVLFACSFFLLVQGSVNAQTKGFWVEPWYQYSKTGQFGNTDNFSWGYDRKIGDTVSSESPQDIGKYWDARTVFANQFGITGGYQFNSGFSVIAGISSRAINIGEKRYNWPHQDQSTDINIRLNYLSFLVGGDYEFYLGEKLTLSPSAGVTINMLQKVEDDFAARTTLLDAKSRYKANTVGLTGGLNFGYKIRPSLSVGLGLNYSQDVTDAEDKDATYDLYNFTHDWGHKQVHYYTPAREKRFNYDLGLRIGVLYNFGR